MQNAILDRIREGNIDLEMDKDGRSVLSDQPLYELRQYISALEAGYCRLRQAQKLRAKIDTAAAKTIVEREMGTPWDKIKSAIERDKPQRVVCAVVGRDNVRYGNCPACGYLVKEEANSCCGFCGQLLDWGA